MLTQAPYMFQVTQLKGCPKCQGDLVNAEVDEIYCLQCGYREFLNAPNVVLVPSDRPYLKKQEQPRNEHGRLQAQRSSKWSR